MCENRCGCGGSYYGSCRRTCCTAVPYEIVRMSTVTQPGTAVADLEATATTEEIVTGVNALLASLRTAGLIEK